MFSRAIASSALLLAFGMPQKNSGKGLNACGLTDTRKRVVKSPLMANSKRKEPTMLAYVLAQLDEWKGRWSEVAEGSDLSKRTIEKIASGEISDPGVSRVQRLHDWFRKQEKAAA